MDRFELKERLVAFAARVFRLQGVLKRRGASDYANQMLRSSSSIGANYHEAVHGRSSAEFLAKIKLAESEAAETQYWLPVVSAAGIVKPESLADLINEAAQITAILHSTAETCKTNMAKAKLERPRPPRANHPGTQTNSKS